MDIIERIRRNVRPNSEIPKPEATEPFRVKKWGKRRNSNALVYCIPNKNGGKPYEKGITEEEFLLAYKRLVDTGTFTREWFNQNMPKCAKEGGCNFTTIGGIFNLVGEAHYVSVGTYRKI